MYFRFIPRHLFSLDDEGRFYRRLYFLGMNFLCKRKKPLPAPPPAWEKYKDLPIQSNKILLRTIFNGYCGNAKYVAEEIFRQQLPYELVWVITPDSLMYLDSYPPNIQLVVPGTKEADIAYATCKVSMDDVHRDIKNGYKKKAEQYHIMTWHGHPYKKISHHELCTLNAQHLKWWRKDRPDYLLGDSEWELRILRCVFANSGKPCAIGYPRNDVFFRPNEEKKAIRTRVRELLGVPENKKILLYAPTWRDDYNLRWNTLDYNAALHACERKFGGEWVIATRMHRMMFAQRRRLDHRKIHVYDTTPCPDTQEILVAVDALISDYSGIQTDFYLTGKPAFIFAPDEYEYAHTRGLYFPLETLPSSIARDNETLVKNIKNFDQSHFQNKIDKHLRDQGIVADGHAAERLVELIKKLAPLPISETVDQ